ncbi:MAG: hypothetical protein H7838_10120 [Magnetococcus sp. DMHC-8]
MSQSSFAIPNQPGATYRAAVNAALQALASQSAGDAEPDVKYPGMQWADTANAVLKQRDASNASWLIVAPLDALTTPTVSSDRTLLPRDYGKVLFCSGTITLSLSSASSLGAGWTCRIKNVGTGTVTLDPNGSETIDGAPSWAISIQWEEISLVCDGANFFVVSGLSGRVVTLDKIARGTSGNVLGWDSDGNPLSMPPMGGITQDRMYWIQDRNMAGYTGGNSDNSNMDRKFNTVLRNTIDTTTVHSGTSDLGIVYDNGYGHIRYMPAGKYFAIGMAVAYTSSNHRLDLKQSFNSGSPNIISGMAGYNSSQGVQVNDIVMGHFEYTSGCQYNDAIQLQHYFKTTSTDGKGKAMDVGQWNVLADLKIWKLS